MPSPLLVIDTNVVLDLLHFYDAAATPLLSALRRQQVQCVATAETLDELRRVLAYPEFAMESARQAALFETYQNMVMTWDSPVPSIKLPRCSDPDDQKFLQLAAMAQAQVLVSKDRALLRLRRRCAAFFQIMTPVETVRWVRGITPQSEAGI